MSTHPMNEPDYRRDLGDGLILRWSTAADTEGIAQLYGYVFRNKEQDPLNTNLGNWTRDMMSGRHPLIGPGDFAVVEDTRRGEIVASTCLLHQTLEYAGVPFEMGRPEVVASLPEYRNRGLVRSIFELIHARCAAQDYIMQGITGIPYYYRQFGYEFALDLGGGRTVDLTDIPKLKDDATEPYHLRAATLEDMPTLLALYERERTFKRQLPNESQSAAPLVTTIDLEPYWRWQLDGQAPEVTQGWVTQLIVNAEDQAIGYVLSQRMRWDEAFWVSGLMVEPGVSLAAVMPSVLRALQASIGSVPTYKSDTKTATRLGFNLFRAHPVYEVLGQELAHRRLPSYSWYIRVPDLPGFIRHIAPALERRLEDSPLTGHTGELKLDFYRGGLRLQFEHGRLVAAEDWRRPVWGAEVTAGFPPLVFLQLLFGHRSFADLREQLPDVWANSDAVLLETLFPRQVSWMIPLD